MSGIAAKVHFETAALGAERRQHHPPNNDIKAAIDASQARSSPASRSARVEPDRRAGRRRLVQVERAHRRQGRRHDLRELLHLGRRQRQHGRRHAGQLRELRGRLRQRQQRRDQGARSPWRPSSASGTTSRAPAKRTGDGSHHRDPMSQDLFDAEVDLTWANDSAFDSVQVRFPGDSAGNGVIPANRHARRPSPERRRPPRTSTTSSAFARAATSTSCPTVRPARGRLLRDEAASPRVPEHRFAGVLALRPRARRNLPAEAPPYRQHQDQRARVLARLRPRLLRRAAEQSARRRRGCRRSAAALATRATSAVQGNTCVQSGQERYRTNWPVNLGTITNSTNVINLGVSYRF